MKFWDSSAVVPLLVEEPASAGRLAQLESDPAILVWWATPLECCSALQRAARSGALDQPDVEAAITRLRELERHWIEIEPAHVVRQQAERMLRLHPLRAADALQLAAAVVASNFEPDSLAFLTGDARLADAARKEGFVLA